MGWGGNFDANPRYQFEHLAAPGQARDAISSVRFIICDNGEGPFGERQRAKASSNVHLEHVAALEQPGLPKLLHVLLQMAGDQGAQAIHKLIVVPTPH